MPHFCGGNRQAPIRRKTFIQGGTMLSGLAATTRPEHSGASAAECAWLRRGGGALARDECVVWTRVWTSPNFSLIRTTTYQPIRLSQRLMCNGAGVWYWQQGRGGMVRVLYVECRGCVRCTHRIYEVFRCAGE